MANRNPWKNARLSVAVWVVLLFFMASWILVNNEPEQIEAKKPEDEVVTYQVEKDNRSGEIFDVQIIRCKVCGDVISYMKFDRFGHLVWGNYNSAHICGLKSRQFMAHRFTGMAFSSWRWPSISAMLDYYQKKWKLRR